MVDLTKDNTSDADINKINSIWEGDMHIILTGPTSTAITSSCVWANEGESIVMYCISPVDKTAYNWHQQLLLLQINCETHWLATAALRVLVACYKLSPVECDERAAALKIKCLALPALPGISYERLRKITVVSRQSLIEKYVSN